MGDFPPLLLHLMVVAFGMRLLARRKRCSSSSSFSKRPSFLAPGFYEVRKEEEKPNCPRRCISPSPKVTNSLWGLLFSSPPCRTLLLLLRSPFPGLTHTHTHTHTHRRRRHQSSSNPPPHCQRRRPPLLSLRFPLSPRFRFLLPPPPPPLPPPPLPPAV